jgi:putative transposase
MNRRGPHFSTRFLGFPIPATLRKWILEADKSSKGQKAKTKKSGRPRTESELEKLILKLAKDNSWGYTRILGELRKLGLMSITRNTVKAILKRNGYDIGPKRGPGTWDEFVARHAKTLWQCDFFSKKIVSKSGLRDIFVLIFINVESRRVYISRSTYKPDEQWMVQQAEAFVESTKVDGPRCKILMHDNDGKFSKPFLAALKKGKVKTHRTPIRSPNMAAFAERFVQTIKQECLDHFIVFGHKHMDVLCQEFKTHYHEERPHQGLDNELVSTKPKKKTKSSTNLIERVSIPISEIRCKERLGGLLKSYSRKAA